MDADLDLVLISAGADDSVEVGDRMTVYCNATYVGELLIEKVGPDWASGRMVSDGTRRLPIVGDGVTTRL